VADNKKSQAAIDLGLTRLSIYSGFTPASDVDQFGPLGNGTALYHRAVEPAVLGSAKLIEPSTTWFVQTGVQLVQLVE
jgi:hypothetical protein